MIVSFIFSIFVIFIDIYLLKKELPKMKNLSFKEKFKSVFITIYFSLFLCVFSWFVFINPIIAILLFLHLFLIGLVLNIKKKGSLLLYVLLGDTVLGIYMCICNLCTFDFSVICWYILGIGIYVLPGLSIDESIRDIVWKMKNCTKEVDVKVIKIIKSRLDGSVRKIYIPVLEIEYNGKKNTYMNSSSIYFYKESSLENLKSVLINPNNPNLDTMFGSNDVFIPRIYFRNLKEKQLGVLLFYIVSIVLLLLGILLNSFL